MLTRARFSAEDLERIQATTGRDYELIQGELFEMAPVGYRHAQVVVRIAYLLERWNEQAGLGDVLVEAGFTLERHPDTVRGPDVSFVRAGRVSRQQAEHGFPELAPDLAIEVRSPNDTWSELVEKAEQLMAAGTRTVWLIDPDRFVEVLQPGAESQRLGLDGALSGGEVLPGFRCTVKDLFPA
ncbi:MAG: Uma2 family endonuclease [Chloroflexota bacterium]